MTDATYGRDGLAVGGHGQTVVVTDAETATVTHIVGARPNFMKAAPVIRALQEAGVEQTLVHTGQHYDAAMSDVFFTDLGLPRPDVFLGVGSGTHARQTAALLVALEDAFTTLRPRLVVVYGDVNSTLAAALVAAKTGVPVAHVEAGLRSFDNTMPEEVNRRLVDAVSDVLLVTSPDAIAHLAREGVADERVHLVGNPMIDSLLRVLPSTDPAGVRARLGVPERYAIATLHRPANVDGADDARRMVAALADTSAQVPVVLPLHPRGRAPLSAAGLDELPDVTVVDPLGYLDFVALLQGAAVVLTDSGGVQEETTVLGVPCLTLRPNTERPVTITAGTNRLVTVDEVQGAVAEVLAASPFTGRGPLLWDGHAGPRIAEVLVRYLSVV